LVKIDREEARRYILKYQNLYKPRQLSTDDAILKFIKKIGCIQFDPLSKIAKNADLVLQSRCKGYSEQTLYRLLYEKRELIDGWDKNMSIWATEEWPYFTRRRELYRNKYIHRAGEFNPVRKEIIEKLRKNEYISSNDFDTKTKVNWSWAPTQIGRAVLESMYHRGELVIHHKEGVRKYYGLSQNLIHEFILKKPDPNRREQDFNDWYVKRRIGGLGLLWNRSGGGWLGTSLKKEERTASIQRLLDKDEIVSLNIAGVDDVFYMPKEDVPLLDDTAKCKEASVIAALDNLIWDRKLTLRLFDFDYKWEVYTPAKDRKYGYYVLPIVYGDKFICRFEPIVDRKNSELIIQNWWWEKDIDVTQQMERAFIRCMKSFCRFLRVEKISLSKSLAMDGFKWITDCA
jgi:uncharacterized protein